MKQEARALRQGSGHASNTESPSGGAWKLAKIHCLDHFNDLFPVYVSNFQKLSYFSLIDPRLSFLVRYLYLQNPLTTYLFFTTSQKDTSSHVYLIILDDRYLSYYLPAIF